MTEETAYTTAQLSKLSLDSGPSKETLFQYLDKNLRALVSNKEFLESAIVFPPCNSYFRFLIHQYVSEKYAGQLSSFSVGELNSRRTVVHNTSLSKAMEKPNSVKRKCLKGVLYVPPHARTEGGTPSPRSGERKDSRRKSAKNENSSRMCDDSSLLFKGDDLIFKETPNSRRWRKTKSSSSESGQTSTKEEVTENVDPRRKGNQVNEMEGSKQDRSRTIDTRLDTSRTASSDATESPADGTSTSVDTSDWESLYDESGNSRSSCVLPDIDHSSLKEIEDRIGRVKISTPNDVFIFHSDFEHSDDGDVTSIIEIYGFPEEFKTNDLVNIFSNFVSRGFALKWVDNTHALGIFPTALMAEEALSTNLPNVKTRPIHKATPQSRERAENLVLPSAMRPKTCSVMAKRLVSSALGLKQKVSAEDREKEKKMLQEAREQRRLMVKQKEAAWEGIFLN